MCAITGVPAEGTRVSVRSRGRIAPNGSVTPTRPEQFFLIPFIALLPDFFAYRY
ncbi:MAG: hypothetical protein ACXACO_22505 [Promethearchaeota archaeon]